MKTKILLTVIALVTCSILFAQNKKEKYLPQNLEVLHGEGSFNSELPGIVKTEVANQNAFAASSNFRLDSSICFDWNALTNTWLLGSKDIYINDANGKLTSSLNQTWNGTAWVNNSQYTYTYDANGKLTSYLYQTWGGTVWVNGTKYTYTYDANGKQTSLLYQTWSGTAWVNDYQYISFTYDANGNQTSILRQSWNGTVWVNSYQFLHNYDVNGKDTMALYLSWNGTAWVNSGQHIYTYDANGNRTNDFYQSWNGSSWANYYQLTYKYDANGKLTSSLNQTWNGSSWVNSYQYTYTYEANENETSSVYRNQWNGTTWQYGDSCNYYYSSISGIEYVQISEYADVQIYPNPFSNSTTIEIKSAIVNLKSEIFIYDALGQVVHQQILNSKLETLNLNLPSGIYFYKLNNEKKEIIGKGKLMIQ